jgi:hypothetical protein
VYWCSPTARLDKKIYSTLQKYEKKILIYNTPLENAIKQKLKDEYTLQKNTDDNSRRGRYPSAKESLDENYNNDEPWKTYKLPPVSFKDPQFLPETMDRTFLETMMFDQRIVIQEFGKEICDSICIILDDCLKAKILGDDVFTRLCIQTRHYNLSVFFLSQNYKSIPKEIRQNCRTRIFFPTSNKTELKLIAEENTCQCDYNDWLLIYKFCTREPYTFINFNYDNPIGYQIINQFKEFIDYSEYTK